MTSTRDSGSWNRHFKTSPRTVQVALGARSPVKRLSRCTQTGSTLSVIRLTSCKLIFFLRELSAFLSFSACKKPLDSSREAESKAHFFWILDGLFQFTLLNLSQSCWRSKADMMPCSSSSFPGHLWHTDQFCFDKLHEIGSWIKLQICAPGGIQLLPALVSAGHGLTATA